MVRISSITLDTLLELVGGQVIDELGEDSLSGIHPSLSKIRAASGHPALAPGSAAIQFKSKNESYTLSLVICDFYRGRPDFSRTLLIDHLSWRRFFKVTDRDSDLLNSKQLMCGNFLRFSCAFRL
jgi:hypothetical protein